MTHDYTYVLYINIENQFDVVKTIFLGSCKDPIELYTSGLYIDNVEEKYKSYVLEWIDLYEKELDHHEKYDFEYAFKHNPLDEFSYPIGNMTLVIKKINKFD
jgi:hypothetical protein